MRTDCDSYYMPMSFFNCGGDVVFMCGARDI